MVLAMACLAVAAVSAVAPDRWLVAARWTSDHPRAAMTLWHASAVSVIGMVVAAMLLVAHDVWEHVLLAATERDKDWLHAAYAGGHAVDERWNASMVVVAALFVCLTTRWAWSLRSVARSRGHQRSLPGDWSRIDGLLVVRVRDPRAVAFCVPAAGVVRRRPAMVVVSEGACQALTAQELGVVLAHERSHLRRRHHRAVLVADVVGSLGSMIGLLRRYPDEVRRLVELEADDDAARSHSRKTVASALLAFSTPQAGPAGTLGVGRSATASRVMRLLEHGQSGGNMTPRVLAGAVGVGALVLPPVLLILPLMVAAAS